MLVFILASDDSLFRRRCFYAPDDSVILLADEILLIDVIRFN